MSGFPDYMPINPGTSGTVIANSLVTDGIGGDATLVVGNVGQGRILLAGLDIGAKCVKVGEDYVTTEELSVEEESLLVNSVFWLGQ